jgi:hypothetical protein
MPDDPAAPERAPLAAYQTRLGERREALERCRRDVARLSNARLVAFALLVAVAGLALWRDEVGALWALIPLGLFLLGVDRHRAAGDRRDHTARAVRFYEGRLTRLEHRFRGTGVAGVEHASDRHAYAAQLDLFGAGGLYELLCGAQTESGKRTLAGWLLEPAPPGEIRARQEAVSELGPRLDLREELAVLGPELSEPVDHSGLEPWVASPPAEASPQLRRLLAGLALANVASAAAWFGLGWGPLPLLTLVAVELPIWWALRGRVRAILHELERPTAQLDLVSRVLERLEREAFRAPRLLQIRSTLDASTPSASRRIRRLMRLVELVESRRNQLFAPIAPFLLWATQLAFAIEAWRSSNREAVPRWLAAVGELEALLDLAAYAFDHPHDSFPVLCDHGPRFVAHELGHPLIPEDRCVRNDVQLDEQLRLWVVSGSNMSGKSTLMRSVGVNAVLAFAGAPVRARSLELSPLRIGASLRVLDSLVDGVSHFQAELLRMRLIAGLAGKQPPLLFLLDEIFQGTNSHDRLHGATAILRGLVERGAIGMVSTHDLTLAGIVDALAPHARNVHFADELLRGEMTFDYRLRDGVVERSNAVALMRAVGLDV